MKAAATLLFVLICAGLSAQTAYLDSLTDYQHRYVNEHEVVVDSLKGGFHFFPVDEAYKVTATVKEIKNSPWFSVETSGTQRKSFRVYAVAKFQLNGKPVELQLLQSQFLGGEYKDYLFLPFTDLTNGNETYDNGRYIDLAISDIRNNSITIDFNKAYNPYCAYVSGKYNCPVPPKANRLDLEIRAGELKFGSRP